MRSTRPRDTGAPCLHEVGWRMGGWVGRWNRMHGRVRASISSHTHGALFIFNAGTCAEFSAEPERAAPLPTSQILLFRVLLYRIYAI